MPGPDALATAQEFRDALLRQERAAATRLVNAYGDIYQRLQSQIDGLTAELDALQARGELSIWRAGKLDRLIALKRQVEVEVTRYGVLVENEVNQGARLAIIAGQESAKRVTQAALPGLAPIDATIMEGWQSLNPGAVERLLGFLSDESPLRTALRERLGPEVADGVAKKLVEGIGTGYNPAKTARIIRDQLGQGLTWSLRTTRTAQLYAYRESTRAAYIANDRIVRGWTWQSARKENTCMACLAMDGTHHALSENLNDHYNGACVMLPDTLSYRELGFDVQEPPSVLEHETGEAWFGAQAESRQRQMMGPAKFDAWKRGEIKFSDFPHTDEDPVYGPMRSEASLKSLIGSAT